MMTGEMVERKMENWVLISSGMQEGWQGSQSS